MGSSPSFLIGHYNALLVAISLSVAILASYTALNMADRVTTSSGRTAARWWLAGGAFAMGTGIWSMHFIGMLAFQLPIPLGYDVKLTVWSLLIAIAISGLALWLVSRTDLPTRALGSGALLMGIGIAAMHYTGMAAMQMQPAIEYDPLLFAASIAIAILAAGAALKIAFTLRNHTPKVWQSRLGAAVVMGIAIVAMHYTGMAAARFPEGSVCLAARDGVGPGWMAALILVITLAVLTIALLTAVLDSRLESKTAKLAISLAEVNEELAHRALHDTLTRLPNRTLLEDRLSQAIHKGTRERGHFALMFMDLDGFKTINDSLGHHVGDMLLVEVANRLRSTMRAQDTIARLGGDEFVVLAELEDPQDAAPIAHKLVTLINAPFKIGNQELGVSLSLGIAIFPEDGTNRHDLVVNADAAMYHTKRSGRNGYHFFEASMNVNAHTQLTWLHDMRQALERKEFMLYYQPKFGNGGVMLGAEALLRWQHPVRGLVRAEEFIPLAEKSGLIIQIGEWVLDEACRQMRAWYDLGHEQWRVAVNLSALQFAHPNLLPLIQACLLRYDLPPRCLTLEVTESTAMHDAETSLKTLGSIADLGIDISIDDFGTGYSSLMYLKRLPANELKIDRGFVRDLTEGSDGAAIVEAIVALGHTLKLRVVAEGVETEAQQALLTRLGCDVIQGYLTGHPMPADSLMQVLGKAELQA